MTEKWQKLPKIANKLLKSAQRCRKVSKGGISLYWCYYPHTPRELVSPVCVIFSRTRRYDAPRKPTFISRWVILPLEKFFFFGMRKIYFFFTFENLEMWALARILQFTNYQNQREGGGGGGIANTGQSNKQTQIIVSYIKLKKI